MKSAEHTEAADLLWRLKKDEEKHVVAIRFESFRLPWLHSRMAALLEPQPNFTRTFPCQAKGKIMLLIQKLEEECVRLPRNWN